MNSFEIRQIRNTLVSDGYIFTGAELTGGVNFAESVNAGEDLTIGSCIISSIDFQLRDLNYLVHELTGREFIWKKALQTGETTFQRFIKASRSKLVCLNGGIGYVVSERAPYLSIWDADTNTKIKDVASKPELPVKGLALVGNKLYCLHAEAPYLTTYTVAGQDLTLTENADLNQFEINKIKYLGGLGYSCNVQGDILKEYIVSLYDLKPDNLTEHTYEYVQMGLYTAEKPTKVNDTLVKVTCMDRLNRFSAYVDDWIKSVKHPVTLKTYLSGLCNYIGVSLVESSFLNQDYQVKRSYTGQNVTGIQVLRWIAEIAACFGRLDAQGRLELGWYTPKDMVLDSSVYATISTEEYETALIDKLVVRTVENDIGVEVPKDDPTKKNVYILEGNPLLYALTDDELRPTAEKIFNAINKITYRPFTLKMVENPTLRAGDIVTVTTKKGLTFPAYIMSRSLKGGFDEYSSTGNPERLVQADVQQQQIQALRMRSNELTLDLEKTQNTLTTVSTELGEVTTDVNGISTRLDTVTTEVGDLKLTSNNFGVRLSSTEQSLNTVTGELTTTNQKVASLELSLDGFFVNLDKSGLSFTEDGLTSTNIITNTNGEIIHRLSCTLGLGALSFTVDGEQAMKIEVNHYRSDWAGKYYTQIDGSFWELHAWTIYPEFIMWEFRGSWYLVSEFSRGSGKYGLGFIT